MKRLLSIMTLAMATSIGWQSTDVVAAPFVSGSGTATCELNASVFGSSDCTLQAITAHGAWQQEGAGQLTGSTAKWVSYTNTGVGAGALLAPIPTTTSDTPGDLSSVPWLLKVTEQFYIGAGGGGIDIKIWADDTAAVYLNDGLVQSHNLLQDVCAKGILGCQPDEFFQFAQNLDAGEYTLDFYVYQLGMGNVAGGNPFGLIYGGDLRGATVPVPVPAGLALLLPGLVLLGYRRRNP